ncbi:AI-2E family transporter [Natronospora cellulosivora (SeqCode)]
MLLLKKYRNLIFDIVLACIVLFIAYMFRDNIMSVIRPFLYAFVLAYFFSPLVNFIERRGVHRLLSVAIVFFFMFIIVYTIFRAFIPTLAREITNFVKEIPGIVVYVEEIIRDLRTGELSVIPESIYRYLDIDNELNRIATVIRSSFDQFANILLASTGTFLDIFLTVIISFYYLKDKNKLLNYYLSLFTEERKEKVMDIIGEVDKVIGGYIRGQVMVATFVGTLTGVGSAVIGVPYSLTIGLVAGLTNMIPYFGPWIGGILPVVIALMNEPITALWVLIWIVIVQQIESSFVSPQVMSHSVGLHPLTVIFSVMFFGSVLGVPGLIIGVPVAGIIKVFRKYLIEYREAFRKLGEEG